MSKLDKLIKELCPDGVEYKFLWEITDWDKRFNGVDNLKQSKIIKYNYFLAAELKSLNRTNGNVKILTTNVTNLWASEDDVKDNLTEGEVVCIPSGGNPIVQYYSGKFITGDNRIATSKDKNKLNNKYFYYCLQNKMLEITSFYRGSGIKHPNMNEVLHIKIPLPPLPVQEEIVRILDTFTELTAELTAEFTSRKKQYNYYKYHLLKFNDNMEKVTLNDITVNIKSGRNSEKFETGKYPVYGSTGIIGYCNNYSHDKEQILIARVGANAGYVQIAKGLYDVSDNTIIVEPCEKIILKYLFYVLENMKLNKYSRGAGQPLLTGGQLKEIELLLPSIEEQQRIVDILDRFDTLCNDISKGLPAEIKMRQQQYEYYRDKLLNFKDINKEV